ncbi:hypothetical protein DF186_21105, partial [Enterococcus hirae]
RLADLSRLAGAQCADPRGDLLEMAGAFLEGRAAHRRQRPGGQRNAVRAAAQRIGAGHRRSAAGLQLHE